MKAMSVPPAKTNALRADSNRLLHVRDRLDIDERDAVSQSAGSIREPSPPFSYNADLRGSAPSPYTVIIRTQRYPLVPRQNATARKYGLNSYDVLLSAESFAAARPAGVCFSKPR